MSYDFTELAASEYLEIVSICLAPHLPPRDIVLAVERSGGVQAQVMSAAEIAIGARVDGISPQVVQNELWQERSLIKSWVIRAALHLISAGDYPLYVAARSLTDIRNWPYYFEYYGIKATLLEDYLAAALEVLSDEPMIG